MSDGVRILKTDKGVFRIEKRLRVATATQQERYDAEKNALTQLRRAGGCNNINFLYEEVIHDSSLHRSLILEHCDLGTLEEAIQHQISIKRPFEEAFVWHVFAQMAAALAMCHFGMRNPLHPQYKIMNWNTITHLDIKPANIFLSSTKPRELEYTHYPRIVLGDFGCAISKKDIEEGQHSREKQPFGTEGWFPPEAVSPSGKLQACDYGKQTDIWQLGGLIQVMCILRSEPVMDLVDQGSATNGFSDEMDPGVAVCMSREPIKRLDVPNIAFGCRKSMEKLHLVKGVPF